MVYARQVGERVLTFCVSGMLWNRSLVMQDVETESLWSHILGECMRGDLEGKTLPIIPAVMTTWEDWKDEHPETTVLDLSRTARGFDDKVYRQADRYVFGVVLDGVAKAYSFAHLEKQRIVEDRIGDEPILVYFDPASTRAVIYSRRLDGETLSFEAKLKDGTLLDKETRSRWDPLGGEVTRGPLKKKELRLEMLPGIVSFTRAWKVFHPESAYWSPTGSRRARF